MGAWVLLRAFDSEAEARVVESFLVSSGIPVQLLGTYSRYTVMVPGHTKSNGMQLLVPKNDLDRAKDLLHEQERMAHLSVVGAENGPPPKLDWRADKIIIVLLLLVAFAIFVARYLHI